MPSADNASLLLLVRFLSTGKNKMLPRDDEHQDGGQQERHTSCNPHREVINGTVSAGNRAHANENGDGPTTEVLDEALDTACGAHRTRILDVVAEP